MDEDGYLEVRHHLFRELALLVDLWEQYGQLFRSGESVRVLNEHAQWFFARVQALMLQGVVLSISRLTDPAETRGRRNVSVRALVEDPRARPETLAGAELHARIRTVEALAVGVRRHRNRLFAHSDHAVAMGQEPLPEVSVDQVEQVIQLLVEIHRLYSTEILDRDPDHAMHTLSGATGLLAALRAAPTRRERLRAEEEEDLRQWGGTAAPPDPERDP